MDQSVETTIIRFSHTTFNCSSWMPSTTALSRDGLVYSNLRLVRSISISSNKGALDALLGARNWRPDLLILQLESRDGGSQAANRAQYSQCSDHAREQGKSLSLICGSLTWLRDQQRKRFDECLEDEENSG